MTEWVTSGAEWTPEVRRAVEALELQNDPQRLAQIYCPGHDAGGGDRAGAVYSTRWGPLLVGEMPFPVPQYLIGRAFRVESDPAVPNTLGAESGAVTIGRSGDG